jgi:hypothetical protein
MRESFVLIIFSARMLKTPYWIKNNGWVQGGKIFRD